MRFLSSQKLYDLKRHVTWRNFNLLGAILSAILWVIATDTGWISSIKFLSHISMATMVFTFVAAWRADVPNKRRRGDQF